jgi:dTDP-4-amino-4,6-dideoxygalactose transaminase
MGATACCSTRYTCSAADTPAWFGGAPLFPAPLPMVRPVLPGAGRVLGSFRGLFASGQITNGRFVGRLETEAARVLGVPECVAVSSCTAGLMLVERCLELRGQVIVPSFTFFATAHSLLWNGLEPVLVDCDPATWNIGLDSIRKALRHGGGRISAIVAVHIFGNPAPAAALEAIAREAGVRLIFDAAHGFGARAGARPVGSFGDAEVFSLSPTKTLVAGEGGIVATRDGALARELRKARNYGHDGDYDCSVLGLSARLTEFQAALALAGLPQVQASVSQRNALAAAYEHCLRGQPGLRLQHIASSDLSARKDFSVVIEAAQFGVPRDFLQRALEAENVPLRRYFDPPLHRQRLYRGYYRPELEPLENTARISSGVLSLPIYPALSERDAGRLAARLLAIRDWALRYGREDDAAQGKPAADLAVEAGAFAPHYAKPADALCRARPET